MTTATDRIDPEATAISTCATQLEAHATKLTATVNGTLSANEIEKFEISSDSDPEAEEHVFQVACKVALHFATRLQYSNYHTWEFYRNKTKQQVRQTASQLWTELYPFSTCIGNASQTSTALKEALLADEELAKYAQDVQFATAARTVEEVTALSHCVTMVRFWDHCIVIDLSAQPTAFKVDLGCCYVAPRRMMSFRLAYSCFPYAYIQGAYGARMLVQCKTPDNQNSSAADDRSAKVPGHLYNGPYVDVEGGVRGGAINYAFPTANPTLDTPLGPMPRRRMIVGHGIWDYAPAKEWGVFSEPLGDGKYLVDTISLRIDFFKQELVIQVPTPDWLYKPENKHLEKRVEACPGEIDRYQVTVKHLPLGGPDVLDLPTKGLSETALEGLQLFDEIGVALGLPEGEVLRIGHVVADFWKQTLQNYQGEPITDDIWFGPVEAMQRAQDD